MDLMKGLDCIMCVLSSLYNCFSKTVHWTFI